VGNLGIESVMSRDGKRGSIKTYAAVIASHCIKKGKSGELNVDVGRE